MPRKTVALEPAHEQIIRTDEQVKALHGAFSAHEVHDASRFADIVKTQLDLTTKLTILDKMFTSLRAQLWLVGSLVVVLIPVIMKYILK